MANNPGETPSDDLLEQILGFHRYVVGDGANLVGNEAARTAMRLQLGSPHVGGMGMGLEVGAYGARGFPPGLSLEQGNKIGFTGASGSAHRFHDVVDSRVSSSLKPGFRGQTMTNAVPYPPEIRPRVRARRGQATDPHSIAERLRRERIAEKIRALQHLVPSVNKTDRAVMYDEIVDYVKFLEIQVKVLRISRLGGVGAVAPLVTDIPLSAIHDEGIDGGRSELAWEKWSNDGMEQKVSKLMEENVGAAMQFLQSKALCLVPISLASAIYHTQPTENTTTLVNPDSNPQS